MPLRTLSLALLADDDPDPAVAIRYALNLAGRASAHLLARIRVPPLIVPTPGFPMHAAASQMLALVEEENVDRRARAAQMALMIRAEAERMGVTADVEILSAAYDPPTPHLLRMARVSDVCIAPAPPASEPQQRDILIDMLFGAGAPLLIVPAKGADLGPVRKAIVAWDGGASAARAARDALPWLVEAETVEVVSVLGEKDIGDQASGADIARHLARHCREVCVTVLPVGEQGVAAALSARGTSTHADLMVMGGYGHSRLREFILGGVTRDTFARTEIPTLLSH